MDAIKAAAEKMFAEQTWENFIAFINEILKAIFGFVVKEEGWNPEVAE
jgi:hypothetical protein